MINVRLRSESILTLSFFSSVPQLKCNSILINYLKITMFTCSGWLGDTCQLRVWYCLKWLLHQEDAQDHIDLILSLKHQPNISIVDFANQIAAHGNQTSIHHTKVGFYPTQQRIFQKLRMTIFPLTCPGFHPVLIVVFTKRDVIEKTGNPSNHTLHYLP